MDWRKLALELALVHGKMTDRAAVIVDRALRDQGVLDRDEAEFLVQLKRAATEAPLVFDQLVFEVIKRIVLMDGVINAAEAAWLRRTIFADRVVSPFELRFLEELRREARTTCPEFEALYHDCKFSPEFSRH